MVRKVVLLGVAGMVAGVLVARVLMPGREEMRLAAYQFVPAGASHVKESQNTGHPLIVGSYSVHLEFESPLPARPPGTWRLAQESRYRGGTKLSYAKGVLSASVISLVPSGDKRVSVEIDEQVQNRHYLAAAALGALGGSVAAFVVMRLTASRRAFV